METIYGNYYDKFTSKNPITRMVLSGFMKAFYRMLSKIHQPREIVEIGCGDGTFISRWQEQLETAGNIRGVDHGFSVLKEGKRKYQGIFLYQASVYALPFPSDMFDLVIAPEVLEHLDDPRLGLKECKRIGRKWFIFSVPREPVWRIGNMLSGRYWKQWGNTPGHIQHWSARAFVSFIDEQIHVVETASPFPWTIVLARKK